MDDDTSALASAIGARVKLGRQSRRWTLDQLAHAAGISRRMLVNVEQGTVNPSVGTLLRISDALGVGLPALVEPPRPAVVKVTRHGQGAVLWSGSGGGRGVLVAGTEPPDVVELWDWTLGPGDRHASEPHTAGTRELLQVREGRILLEVAGRSITLAAGDAVSFPGDIPHSYANLSGETVQPRAGADPEAGSTESTAHFCLAVFEPGVGSPSTAPSTVPSTEPSPSPSPSPPAGPPSSA